ncbi:MAG: Ig-like domain-containing protein [Saprospiraceae bacterium]
MNKNVFVIMIFGILILNGCIGDDIIEDRVDPVVRVSNPIDTLKNGTSYQFEATFFNQVGKEEMVDLSWSSSDENIISVSETGLANALQIGNTLITVEGLAPTGEQVSAELLVAVGEETIGSVSERTGTLQTTSSYELKGDFVLKEEGGVLKLSFADNYKASTALPGLYIYLTNNPSTTAGAFEIGAVTVYEGVHSYELPNSIELMGYQYVLYFCKPFNVKVGDGEFN